MNFVLPRCLLLMIFIGVCIPVFANTQQVQHTSIQKKLVTLEDSSGGRIGISAINTANNMQLQYRANERFPMGCTSKVMGVSAILKRSMVNSAFLQQKITYMKKDLTNWTPVTEKHLVDGMTIAELSEAAISYSDNTAMNLLVKKLGGLQQINAFARSIGDKAFRLDHWWPEEAMSGPDSLCDSSTPAAMEKSLQKLVLGNVLGLTQRERLQTWLKNNTTGNEQIRAGVPKGWVVGDKTGKGFYHGTTNDIGVIWPPKCAPIVVSIYYTNNKKVTPKRDDIIASVTRILINEFARTDHCIQLYSS
ncbi:MAG: class A beta-lactamase [Rickettsiella sp.]|nr:class A beta-lactamase [Rickettsiella sp.]